jgi:hypothetical protein
MKHLIAPLDAAVDWTCCPRSRTIATCNPASLKMIASADTLQLGVLWSSIVQ